jgi:acyl-CoA synthetase (AMP-forming)/AMP-acid ligase II
MNCFWLLDIPASIGPDHVAVVDGPRRWTYAELLRDVRRWAGVLTSCAVGPGDRVAFVDVNRAEAVILLFASALVGAAFVPLNFRSRPEELADLLDRAAVRTVAGGARYLPGLRMLGVSRPHLTVLDLDGPAVPETAAGPAAPPDADEEAPAVLLYTSGTTRRPKAVVLSHGDLTAYVQNQVEPFDGTERGAALTAVPLYHVAGLTGVLSSIYGGRRTVLLPQFEAGMWLRTVAAERCTFAFLVPTMLKQVLDHPEFDRTDLSSLETLAYGAAPMPAPVLEEALGRFPPHVGFVGAFGMTETTSTVTVLTPEDHRPQDDSPAETARWRARLRSVGRPLADVEVQIRGPDGASLPPGAVGRVALRTPRLMRGYLAEGGPERPVDAEGWLVSDDLGYLDAEGYLFLLGRADDVIIRGGENIAPAEVEDVLSRHPAVAEVAVVGQPSLLWGQEVLAVVVPRDPERPPTLDDLQAFCRDRLAGFKKPTALRIVAELPRTATGKVLRRRLRDEAEAGTP